LHVQDFYGKGYFFSSKAEYGESSVKIKKKGLILAITPVKSIKRMIFKEGDIFSLIKGSIS
jgi:hypothetical protein